MTLSGYTKSGELTTWNPSIPLSSRTHINRGNRLPFLVLYHAYLILFFLLMTPDVIDYTYI
jgi:hypothetical protein